MQFNEIPKTSLFTEDFDKLSDILVPLETFNIMVQYMEGSDYLNYACNINGTDVSGTMFMMPYVYTTPYDDYQAICNIENTSERLVKMNTWKYNVEQQRIKPYMENAIPIYKMLEIDDDPDIAMIAHVTTGRIICYRRSCVRDLIVFGINDDLHEIKRIAAEVNMLNNSDIDISEVPEFFPMVKKMNKLLTESPYQLFYLFDYIKPDEFNPTCSPIVGNINSSIMDINTANAVAATIMDGFAKKKRIILIA